jgi:hypothetical protein
MTDIQQPSTPIRQEDMTRDERIEAQVYRGLGWTYKQIGAHMGKTMQQVQTACTSPATPKKKCGRRATITVAMRQELVDFVCASPWNRLMPYAKILEAIGWNVSEAQIRRALQKEGSARQVARAKPPISEANRVARLAWARAHVHWTEEEWGKILWTDESWVTGGRHTKSMRYSEGRRRTGAILCCGACWEEKKMDDLGIYFPSRGKRAIHLLGERLGDYQ